MTKSPTLRLLLGLLFTLTAVGVFCIYSLHQLSFLRQLQTDTIDLNRHDSLLLLRVQNDVNTLGLKLQQMTETHPHAKIVRFRQGLNRVRDDLNRAVGADGRLPIPLQRAAARKDLLESIRRFWTVWDEAYRFAQAGQEQEARRLAAEDLSDQQIILERLLSQLLEENNVADARADATIAAVYDNSAHRIYAFLIATIAAVLVTGLYVIYSNRVIFDRLSVLSTQRQILAERLINVQEEVLRSVSRELHDEFGQILTAVGAMLARAERKGIPADSPFRTELSEVREITHNTLEKMRALSQMLHPAILDDYGLVNGIEWYMGVFQRQTGIETSCRLVGTPVLLKGPIAMHCFRIVQEALTNAAKHSQSKSAQVTLTFHETTLRIDIRDFGAGALDISHSKKMGLGMIAMRERTEILHGTLNIVSTPQAGTNVSLIIPMPTPDDVLSSKSNSSAKEVLEASLLP